MKEKTDPGIIAWVITCISLMVLLLIMYAMSINKESKIIKVEYDNTLINNTIQQEIKPLKEQINILEEKINNL